MVGTRRFKLIIGIIIPFLLISLMSQNIYAVEFNRWLNIQHISKTNLSNTWTTYNVPNAGSYSVAGASSLSTYRLSASANLSSQATGAYFSASGDIYLDIASNLEGGVICNLINSASIMPEYVSYNSSSSVLSSCNVSNLNNYQRRYTLHIESSGSIPSQATFTSFAWTIGNSAHEPIISLVGTPDDPPGVIISGNINISIGNSPELEGLGVINQNITIISNDLKDMQQQMSDNTDAIIDNQNDNTDAIINNQNENTDAIIKSNQHCYKPNLIPINSGSLNFNNNRNFGFNSTLSPGTYTLSFNLDSFSLGSNTSFGIYGGFYNESGPFFDKNFLTISSSTSTSTRYSSTFNLTDDVILYNVRLTLSNWNNGARAILSQVQLEKGSSATEYVPYGEEVCKNVNQEYYDEQRQADQNISNQSPSDIDGAENQATTNLIGVLSGFISAFSNINATNCNLTLDFPNYAGGSRVVDICQGKEKAPRIVEIGSSLLLIGVFVPLAYILIRMIYNEIRSWTNG